jgi:hypothetical protein
VKAGHFFQIPERPRDLHDLWRRASALPPYAVPEWLDREDAHALRLVDAVSSAGLSADEMAAFHAEIEEMELGRLIVDRDPQDPQRHRVYMVGPASEATWSIGVYQGPSPLGFGPAAVAQPVLTAESVTDVTASFVADPFWLRDPQAGAPGRWHMFFEVMNWKANKGEIGLATSDDGLHWRYEQIVLAEEFHLSYPHVLGAEDGVYMVPESFQDDSVRLYRARRFPYEWEHAETLLSGGYYVDSSLFLHGETWWLFTDSGEHTDDTLRLFFADRLHGPWREHPRSPVVSGDNSISRPAGRVLAMPERLVRFAQNCSVEYGADVRAIEITRLTRTEYEERPLPGPPLLGPRGHGWNAGGMHHIDAIQRGPGDWLAAVDGWRIEPDK